MTWSERSRAILSSCDGRMLNPTPYSERTIERIEALAKDYGISADRVETALRWEQCALAA
jgi:hypothetical protein